MGGKSSKVNNSIINQSYSGGLPLHNVGIGYMRKLDALGVFPSQGDQVSQRRREIVLLLREMTGSVKDEGLATFKRERRKIIHKKVMNKKFLSQMEREKFKNERYSIISNQEQLRIYLQAVDGDKYNGNGDSNIGEVSNRKNYMLDDTNGGNNVGNDHNLDMDNGDEHTGDKYTGNDITISERSKKVRVINICSYNGEDHMKRYHYMHCNQVFQNILSITLREKCINFLSNPQKVLYVTFNEKRGIYFPEIDLCVITDYVSKGDLVEEYNNIMSIPVEKKILFSGSGDETIDRFILKDVISPRFQNALAGFCQTSGYKIKDKQTHDAILTYLSSELGLLYDSEYNANKNYHQDIIKAWIYISGQFSATELLLSRENVYNQSNVDIKNINLELQEGDFYIMEATDEKWKYELLNKHRNNMTPVTIPLVLETTDHIKNRLTKNS